MSCVTLCYENNPLKQVKLTNIFVITVKVSYISILIWYSYSFYPVKMPILEDNTPKDEFL